MNNETRSKLAANKPQHILITGLPGSGKTTLAKKIAGELGLPLISLDEVAAKNKRWAGTADARKFIRRLDTPHVIEGTQLLGFRKEDLKGHQVHVLEEPKSVLVDRLVRRGWNDSSGKLHKGEGARARTEAFHDDLSSALIDFKKTAAQKVRGYTRKDGTRVKGYTRIIQDLEDTIGKSDDQLDKLGILESLMDLHPGNIGIYNHKPVIIDYEVI